MTGLAMQLGGLGRQPLGPARGARALRSRGATSAAALPSSRAGALGVQSLFSREEKPLTRQPTPADYAYVMPDEAPWPPPYATSSTQGMRDYMEDVLHVKPQTRCGYFYAAVFDGHGGSISAAYLGNERTGLHTVFSDCVDQDERVEVAPYLPEPLGLVCPLSLAPLMTKAFKKADNRLLRYLCELEDPDCFSGSTATTVLLRKDTIIVANVGDSKAIIARGGQTVELTLDHRVEGNSKVCKSETNRIKKAGGWVSDGRVCGILAVTRAFGDIDFKSSRFDLLEELREAGVKEAKRATMQKPVVVPTPDVTELGRKPDDEFLVLASDGVWDVVSADLVATLVRAKINGGFGLQGAADALVQYALEAKSTDNISVVVVDLRH